MHRYGMLRDERPGQGNPRNGRKQRFSTRSLWVPLFRTSVLETRNQFAVARILLTAFDRYEQWSENSSWLTLVELTSWFELSDNIVTRRYPVNLSEMTEMLRADLQDGYDAALHIGQAPGASTIKLESTALNLAHDGESLSSDGPAAFRSA